MQLVQSTIRDKVNYAQSIMEKCPQVDLLVHHFFAEGVVCRELFIPKGIILVGKIHKFSQINVMLTGEMNVLVGDSVKRVIAPDIIVSPAGIKRIAEALDDTVWLTFHGTHETDLDKIEREFIAQDENEYLEFSSRQLTLGF